MGKGYKICTNIKKNGTRLHVVLENIYSVPKLGYDLLSILEALKGGWNIVNKVMHITISKGSPTIEFDGLSMFSTGNCTGVKIIPPDDVESIGMCKIVERIDYEKGHTLYMHTNCLEAGRTNQHICSVPLKK